MQKIELVVFYLILMDVASCQTPENPKGLDYKNLDLSPLRDLNMINNPLGPESNYREAFKNLNVQELKKDLQALLTDSKDWWPADFGNYGPFFIRLSWHAAGTYRVFDGSGGANRGQQRFSPVGSWPDNVNLDKGRLLLWPIKQKYGNSLSWSDLIVLVGTVALDSMGLKTIGFAFGREDDWLGDDTVWGNEQKQLSSNVIDGQLNNQFSATQMGLIYVNPEGPDGVPDRKKSVKDIRSTFKGMGMDDRQTVVLIAGGHTFGKTHGAAPSNKFVGPAPNKSPIQMQGLGWHNKLRSGVGSDTIGSGLQGIWTSKPTEWTHDFFINLYELDWKQKMSSGNAHQWVPTNATDKFKVPDAFNKKQFHWPTFLTTDLALKEDQQFNKFAFELYKNPKEFAKFFAQTWFKLTHRDMGPKSRYLGPWIPQQEFIWQDPVPKANYKQISQQDVVQLKNDVLASGLTTAELVKTAWASASSYRHSDFRGGSNGARIALLPAREWAKNEPEKLAKVLDKLREVQKKFNDGKKDGTKVSLADLIVLAGNAAIEQAALKAGYVMSIPVIPGRTDATQQQTDIQSYNYLNSISDGFINYAEPKWKPELLPQALVQKAGLLTLNPRQMTVLVGGLRVLGANHRNSKKGVFTQKVGRLTNDFFVNLLDLGIQWKDQGNGNYAAYSRSNKEKKWTATTVDLIFGYNAQLRAIAEVYASNKNKQKFVKDFALAWHKVMMLGRFDYTK